jgi:hypothetical protein
MNITGGKYGENKELNELQGSARMAQSQGAAQPAPRKNAQKVTPLFSPTERPDEPLTSGMPFGQGANSLPRGSFRKPSLKETLLKALQNSDDPDLEAAYHYLKMRGEI